MLGETILGYTLEAKLGEGGMGTVYRGVHPDLGQRVAVKVLDPVLARNAEIKERFIQEARIQINLQHPGIVRVLTADLSGEHLAMIMELVDGLSLDVVLKQRGALPLEEAKRLFEQVLAGVGYAHREGVVHRDLKPANVLVQADGTARVMDFGIARVVGNISMTRTGTSMGSPEYMSPEQIMGQKDIDHRTDIYSLGVAFYEVLTGQTPFWTEAGRDTDSDFQIKEAHVRQPPPDPRTLRSDIPEPVALALLKALAKEPKDRFASTAEMQEALFATAVSQPAEEVPVVEAEPVLAPDVVPEPVEAEVLEEAADEPKTQDVEPPEPWVARRLTRGERVFVGIFMAVPVVTGLLLGGRAVYQEWTYHEWEIWPERSAFIQMMSLPEDSRQFAVHGTSWPVVSIERGGLVSVSRRRFLSIDEHPLGGIGDADIFEKIGANLRAHQQGPWMQRDFCPSGSWPPFVLALNVDGPDLHLGELFGDLGRAGACPFAFLARKPSTDPPWTAVHANLVAMPKGPTPSEYPLVGLLVTRQRVSLNSPDFHYARENSPHVDREALERALEEVQSKKDALWLDIRVGVGGANAQQVVDALTVSDPFCLGVGVLKIFYSVDKPTVGMDPVLSPSGKSVLKLDPSSRLGRKLRKADQLCASYKPRKSLRLYKQILEHPSSNEGVVVDAWVGLGNSYLQLKKFDQAIVSYETALAIAPRMSDAHSGIAHAYRDTGNSTAALKHFQQYLDILPSGPKADDATYWINQIANP